MSDLDGFNIVGRDSEIGRRAMSDPEARWKSSGGMSASEKLAELAGPSWLSSTSEQRSALMAVLPQIVAVVEAATLVADYGHEMDDYEMPPKEARRITRAALSALDKALS